MKPLAVVGAGGHGRECLAIAEAMIADGAPYELVGVYDDDPSPDNEARVQRLGHIVEGTVDSLVSKAEVAVCIGVGSGAARRTIADRLSGPAREFPRVRHPDSTVGPGVEIGEGAVIFAGARLTTNIRLGRHVHVGQNVTVGHDSRLHDYVTCFPQAAVSGIVTIQQEATVGAAAVVLQGLTVGNSAYVGAAACVVRDVDEATVVKGVPAK